MRNERRRNDANPLDIEKDAKAMFSEMYGIDPAEALAILTSSYVSAVGAGATTWAAPIITDFIGKNYQNAPDWIQALAKTGQSGLNTVVSWFSTKDEVYKKLLSGQGLDYYDSLGAFGKSLNKDQYKQLQKAASGKTIKTEDELRAVLQEANLGFNEKQINKMVEEFFRTFTDSGVRAAVLQDLSSQFGYFKDALQTEIYNLLDINNYNIDSKDKNLLAQIFAEWGNDKGKTGEELADIIQSLPIDVVKSILEKMDLGSIKLEDYMNTQGKTNFTKFIVEYLGVSQEKNPELYSALKQYLKENLTISPEDLQELSKFLGKDIEELLNYTAEQVKAEQKTYDRLVNLTGSSEDASKLYQNAQNALAGYPAAIKKANAATYDTAEGIRDLAKEFAILKVPVDKGAEAIINLAGGLENLPVESAEDFIASLNKDIEDFNSKLERLGNLREGKGTIDDLAIAIDMLTKGLESADAMQKILEIEKAITVSSEGICLDFAMIGQAGEALANQQLTYAEFMGLIYDSLEEDAMDHAREVIRAAYEEAYGTAKAAALELDTLDQILVAYNAITGGDTNISGATTDKLNAAVDSLKNLHLQSMLIDIQAQTGKAGIEAMKAGDDAEKAAKKAAEAAKRMQEAWQNFVDYLNNVDKYSNLDALLDRIKDKIDNLEFEISFSTNPKEIAKDLKSQLNEVQRQMAGNIAGKRGAERNLLARRNAIRSNSQTKGYLSFGADGNIIINQQKMLALEERIRDAKIKDDEITLAVLEGQKKAIEDNIKAYNDELKAVEKYTKGVQEGLTKTQDIYKNLYEQAKALDDKLIEVIQQREDKELELTKKKYIDLKKRKKIELRN